MRQTWIGNREVNNPMFFVSMPRRLRPKLNPILKENGDQLLTSFDIHAVSGAYTIVMRSRKRALGTMSLWKTWFSSDLLRKTIRTMYAESDRSMFRHSWTFSTAWMRRNARVDCEATPSSDRFQLGRDRVEHCRFLRDSVCASGIERRSKSGRSDGRSAELRPSC